VEDYCRTFPAGTPLFSEGDRGDRMFVVRRGRVKIFRSLGTGEKVLSFLGPGDFLGEMSLLNGKPRTASATTIEESELLVLDREQMETMLLSRPDIALRIVRNLSERLRKADNLVNSLLIPEKPARVVFLIAQAVRDLVPGQPAGPWRTGLDVPSIAMDLGMEVREAEEILRRLAHLQALATEPDGEVVVTSYTALLEIISSFEIGRDLRDRYPEFFGGAPK
jgi:CRP-like cAMP-binding protein